MGMGGGIFWWIVMAVLLVIPFYRILPRYGLPAYAAFLAVFPLVALILLWIIAFKDKFDEAAK
ncbi:hypothetical protein GLS40_12695 [Pseudooceanicola sp. 216_PA32_1]|uniref:NADH dehydrogenase subunit C n=2 Tax=Pseudooceanicola pacificus TaxID=2676438 RepID=A0A844WF45_9RHOB|nr:hypothetical protein [Pseudooceanicola pacificus]